MRWRMVVAISFLASSCGEANEAPLDEAERARQVDAVREANAAAPELEPVTPEPILYPDIERWDLGGQSCAYAPGTSLGARVIAREADAFMKIDGELIRFAADAGSRELPQRTRSVYDGREYSLRLQIADADGERAEGTIWLRDRWDRVVYQGTGLVSCAD